MSRKFHYFCPTCINCSVRRESEIQSYREDLRKQKVWTVASVFKSGCNFRIILFSDCRVCSFTSSALIRVSPDIVITQKNVFDIDLKDTTSDSASLLPGGHLWAELTAVLLNSLTLNHLKTHTQIVPMENPRLKTIFVASLRGNITQEMKYISQLKSFNI